MPLSFQADKEHSDGESLKSLYTKPKVDLLNGRQWQHVQRCYRLSPREVEVAKLVCCGLGNDAVAVHLKITGGTVKTHLRNIYRRVRVNNKIEMLLRFVEMTISLHNQQPIAGGGTFKQGQGH